jgi:hypothetical protein
MFHRNRVWCVTPVGSAEELARKLTTTTWTCCTAFELGGYLWLNDATSPDGAQEFLAVKKAGPNDRPWQVESITVSWCDYAELLAYVERTLRGEDDQNDFAHEVAPALQTPQKHGRCCHCA